MFLKKTNIRKNFQIFESIFKKTDPKISAKRNQFIFKNTF